MSGITSEDTVSGAVVDYIPALRSYAWSLTRRWEDVDDLVQDTLTKAIANAHRFRTGTNLRAWLMTIMRNTFLNQIAKSSRERTGAAECVSSIPTVPGTQEWHIRGNEMMAAITLLPAHYREMLILVVMLGESYQSAADICGVAVGTVKSRVNRARALVLEQMGETTFEDG
jgi:RNA polymerase sigma factor (sigma-70 family)